MGDGDLPVSFGISGGVVIIGLFVFPGFSSLRSLLVDLCCQR